MLDKQIHGVWDVNEDKNTAKWDPNKQIPNLTTVSMTCEPTSEADKQAYNITRHRNVYNNSLIF